MTRKRKNVEEAADAPKKPFEGYGFQNSDNTEKRVEKQSFPSKNNNFDGNSRGRGGGFGGNRGGFDRNREGGYGGDRGGGRGGFDRNRGGGRGGNRRQFGANDFEKQYGRIGGGDDEFKTESEDVKPYEKREKWGNDKFGSDDKRKNWDDNKEKSSGGKDGRDGFPGEIVAYLRNIEQIKKKEGSIEEFILEKCAEEVTGQETDILAWSEAAVVVESVFGSCPFGAALFLTCISRLKHKAQLELMFAGASARTIENLIYKLCPIKSSEHVDLLEKFVDILSDNWVEAVTSQPAAFLIRAILWVSTGLDGRPQEKEKVRNYSNKDMKEKLKTIYEKLSRLAFDEKLNKNVSSNRFFVNILQDFIEADRMWGGKKGDEYIRKVLEADDDGTTIRTAWKDKSASRVWDKLMETCTEDTRSNIWNLAISQNVEELANHPLANFPLQKLISECDSLEMATDVITALSPSFTSFLVPNKNGIAMAMLKCASKHPSAQDKLLKDLRIHFRATKESNKVNFLMNVLTDNNYDGSTFDANKFSVLGCVLACELTKLSKNKTLLKGLESLTAEQIHEMSCHRIVARLIQAILGSTALPDTIKNTVVESFTKDTWESLISNMYGSHVFEAIWDYVDVKKKQEILKILVGIHNTSKFWKFAMLRCDVHLFRKDRKGWVEKMKKWKKE